MTKYIAEFKLPSQLGWTEDHEFETMSEALEYVTKEFAADKYYEYRILETIETTVALVLRPEGGNHV